MEGTRNDFKKRLKEVEWEWSWMKTLILAFAMHVPALENLREWEIVWIRVNGEGV